MKIHEYQGKELFRRFGVPVPRGIAVFSVDEAVSAAHQLGGAVWVVKAQIHAGGRGKGGGVKVQVARRSRKYAADILGMQLVTHQTGPTDKKCAAFWSRKVWISGTNFTSVWLSIGLAACRAYGQFGRRYGH